MDGRRLARHHLWPEETGIHMDALSGDPHVDTDQRAEALAALLTASDGKRPTPGASTARRAEISTSSAHSGPLRSGRPRATGTRRTQPHELHGTADHVARITGADARHTIPAGRSVTGR